MIDAGLWYGRENVSHLRHHSIANGVQSPASFRAQMKHALVLDKSFLDGQPADRIRQLCSTHSVIMVDTLFYELITTPDLKFRAACFRKFPEGENPVEIIDGIASLLRYEIDHNLPASPVYDRRLPIRFKFNDQLGLGTFNWSGQENRDIAEWDAEFTDDVTGMVNAFAVTHEWFPTLADYKGGQPAAEIERARQSIASDTNMIRDIYGKIRRESFPIAMVLSPAWAFFRWLQVRLLFAIEHIRLYGAGRLNIQSKELSQDAADSHYLIVASLAGGFATGEKWLQDAFRLLCPDGVLIT